MAHTCSASSLRFNSLIFSPNPNPNPSSVSDSLSLSLLPSRSRYSIFVFSVKFIIIKPFIFIIIFQIWSSSKFGSVNLRTFRLFNYLSIFFFWCLLMLYNNSICFGFCLLLEKMFTNCYEFEEFKNYSWLWCWGDESNSFLSLVELFGFVWIRIFHIRIKEDQ